MRCDTGPFTDKRVRRALALSIDRKKLVAGLFRGSREIGNDSPFAPAFPSTDHDRAAARAATSRRPSS